MYLIMEEVISTIQHIIQHYGKDVLLEQRFLNIFYDLYPIRMDKGTYSLLSNIVKKGHLRQILKIKKKNLQKEVDSISSSLIKDGHNENNVHDLLYAIIIGADVVSEQEYLEVFNGQKSPNHPNSFKNWDIRHIGFNIIQYGLLLIFFTVASSIPYLYICSLNHVWPFLIITIIIAFIGATLVAYELTEKKCSSLLKGCCLGLIICLSTLLVIFPPLTVLYQECGLFYYWNSIYFASLADNTWLLTLLYAIAAGVLFLIRGLSLIGEVFKDKQQSNNYKLKFSIGAIMSFFCYALCMYTSATKPYYQKKAEFDLYNIKSKELKKNRQNNSKQLSFCGIKLGDNLENCLSIVRSKMGDFSSLGKETTPFLFNSEVIVIDTIDYAVVADSIIEAQTLWDNQKVKLNLYFNKGANFAIKITEIEQNPLPLFISKYGQPEYQIPKLDYDETLRCKIKNNQFLYDGEYKFRCEDSDYRWTFKNSIISIKYLGEDSHSSCILYVNRNCEKLYSEYKLHSKQLEQERIRQEKIEEVREYKEQQHEAAIKKNNHKKALNEI